MQFGNLIIENFMAIGSATINLTSRGLLLIQGENKDDTSQDSNGAGKSSITDALSWCLYGKTARGSGGDAVVHRLAKKNTRVRSEIRVTDDEIYIVTRHRKHKEGKNSIKLEHHVKGSMPTDLTKGTDKLTQGLIDKIIGASSDVFKASIYSGQEDQVDLPGLTDKFLKTIVEEAAGVDKLQEAHTIAKARYNETDKKMSAEHSRLGGLKLSLENDKDLLSSYNEKAEEFEEQRKLKVTGLIAQVNRLSEAIKVRVADYKTKGRAKIEAEIAELETKLKSVESENEEQAALVKEIADISEKTQASRLMIESLVKQAKKLKEKEVNVGKTVGDACDSCGKPVEEHDLTDVKAKIAENLKLVLEEIEFKKPTHAKFKKSLEQATVEQTEHAKSMTDVSTTMSRLDELRSELSELEGEYQGILSDKQDIVTVKSRLDVTSDEVNAQQVLAHEKEKGITEVQAQMTKVEAEIEALDKELRIRKSVVKVFGPAGVRAHILDTVTPQLNSRTSDYLNTLSDGNLTAQWNTLKTNAAGDVREAFNIVVTSKTGGGSFKELSGGEKRKVRLATNLALQDLVASRATKPIDLFIGDEIDHALDTSGLERLMTLLEERARVRGTVLIISHNDLADWCRQQVNIVKEDGYATINDCA